MAQSIDLVQLDLELLAAISLANQDGFVTIRNSGSILKRCQELLRRNPEYGEFYSAVANDFAHLPLDIIVDIVTASQSVLKGYRNCNKRYVLNEYNNMAKIQGSWGVQARGLESFEYSIDEKRAEEDRLIERTFFDEAGELKSHRIAFDEVGHHDVTHAYLENSKSIKPLASNLMEYLEIVTWFNDFDHSRDLQLLHKPKFTQIVFRVWSTDKNWEGFIAAQLKSKILRKLFAVYEGPQPIIGEDWTDLLANFVKKDNFLELSVTTFGIFPKRVFEGALEKWLNGTARSKQIVNMSLSDEDMRYSEDSFNSLVSEGKGQLVNGRYKLQHPSDSDSFADVTFRGSLSATFSVYTEEDF
ncbi:hypothetical protein QR680_011654 [Steinernema hermaphroditum]|uniref:Uncharacterized protein n=1 Tax=Steinernema hermaphroditum TaxID=289476 RepID=A0AA39HZ97_9BILA|nr:hypothetical protein QR680_011654 [Steinernema hermaphroditum]